jgi:hypothetical protein
MASYWLTEEFCKEHGSKSNVQLSQEFPDASPGAWAARKMKMRRMFGKLVPKLTQQGTPPQSEAPAPQDFTVQDKPVSFWLTEDFCRAHGSKGPSQLAQEFGGQGWGQRRANMLKAFPHLVPRLNTQGEPVVAHVTAEGSCPLPEKALITALRTGDKDIVELANHFDCAPSRVQSALEYLRGNHIIVEETAAGLTVGKTLKPSALPLSIDSRQFAETEVPYGWCADLHVGSKYERLDVLEDLADRWEAAGVQRVFCGGNWIDGSGRRFNQHDIYVHGVENQVANFIEKLPRREGMTWEILSGDDHEGWFVQDCHVNIGRVLETTAREMGRDDIIDLGYMERDIELVQDYGSAKMRVMHAGGGSSYATSYTSQKYVETLQGGEKPQAVFVGHFHKFDWCAPREVDVVQMMCTQDQTPFMRKKRLQAHLGGGIAWVRQNELGVITGFKVEKFQYFDKKFYRYQWRKPDASL